MPDNDSLPYPAIRWGVGSERFMLSPLRFGDISDQIKVNLMQRSGYVLIVASLTLFSTSGCQTNEQTGTLVGAGGGALVGGLIGNAIGGRTGALLGSTLGGLAGAFAGSQIGHQLDERDRQRAESATREALRNPPAGRPVNWVSEKNSGTKGTAQVINVQRQATGECRTVRETAYIKGEERVQNARYCQNASGEWLPQT